MIIKLQQKIIQGRLRRIDRRLKAISKKRRALENQIARKKERQKAR